MHSTLKSTTFILILCAAPFCGVDAADVTVVPAAGSAFVVKDAASTTNRFSINENGQVSAPALPAAAVQTQGLCMSATGLLGPCVGGASTSYTAGVGLDLTGDSFSIAPTFKLPQACATNQLAQWSGSAWLCATFAATGLPAGSANQTLYFDAGNALVSTSNLQVFGDGGVLATNAATNAAWLPYVSAPGATPPVGAVPATGFGARMMWYPAKAAFRAGLALGGEWDDANIGTGSVALGYATTASGNNSLALGTSTVASATGATALGSATIASGQVSTAMGLLTTAKGDLSTAMGSKATAYAAATGAFIYGDGSKPVGSVSFAGYTAAHTFTVLASGGVAFFSSSPGDQIDGNWSGVTLAPGAGAWGTLSDRAAKDDFVSADVRTILANVIALPMNTWHYKQQDRSIRHIGPIAQDFYSAFAVGEDERHISTVDADGIALAAIQGLNALIEEKDAQTSRLLNEKDREIETLRERMARLEAVVSELDKTKSHLALDRASAVSASVQKTKVLW